MNSKYTYEWIESNFVVTFIGDISYVDIMEANNVMFRDIRFDTMQFQIFDYSKITSIDLTDNVSDIIANLDAVANVWNKNMKVATVTSDLTLKKCIEEYNEKINTTSWIAKTFDNITDALTWCVEK